jgi:GT2 family glycosyltransferase
MNQPGDMQISVIIPTFQREQVLLDTLYAIFDQSVKASEILVVDQSPQHLAETEAQLARWAEQKKINWIRLSQPSLSVALNTGLRAAQTELVLILDDDIETSQGLIEAHMDAFKQYPDASAVVGQVLQPGEIAKDNELDCVRSGFYADMLFPFWSTKGHWISNAMGGNLSLRREFALSVGGFDENFKDVAFRIETEFARRLMGAGGKIRFFPEASIHHLRHPSGGTRSETDDTAGYSTKQAPGDYYFVFLHAGGNEVRRYIFERLHRELRTQYYLKHPWKIPGKCTAELKALVRGWYLSRQTRKLS